jgi:hypothetical protein
MGLVVRRSDERLSCTVTNFPLFPPQKTGTAAGLAAAQLLRDICLEISSFITKVTSEVHVLFPMPIPSYHIPLYILHISTFVKNYKKASESAYMGHGSGLRGDQISKYNRCHTFCFLSHEISLPYQIFGRNPQIFNSNKIKRHY